MKAENHADYYKRFILILYSILYSVYPHNYQWDYRLSLSTVSLQPGDGSKARYTIQRKQRAFNQMMEMRLASPATPMAGGARYMHPCVRDKRETDAWQLTKIALMGQVHGSKDP